MTESQQIQLILKRKGGATQSVFTAMADLNGADSVSKLEAYTSMRGFLG